MTNDLLDLPGKAQAGPGSGTFSISAHHQRCARASYRPVNQQVQLSSQPRTLSIPTMLATRPCQAIGQRRFGPSSGLLPIRSRTVKARVASPMSQPVAPAVDERGFRLKEVSAHDCITDVLQDRRLVCHVEGTMLALEQQQQ